jgi:septation ring formation regulator EzrA
MSELEMMLEKFESDWCDVAAEMFANGAENSLEVEDFAADFKF